MSMCRPVISQPCVHSADVPVEVLGDGITRQILGHGKTIMTRRTWFESGAVRSVQTHPHGKTTYIESVRFHYQAGDAGWAVGPGDCGYIAPGTDHGMPCIEAGGVIDNFSPMRADFLGQGEL